MTNASKNIKISDFTTLSTAADADVFTFVKNGTNYKITKADLVTLFGVTGSLEQLGDVGGTPILNKSGTTNQIRNLEDGTGVKASVSPQGGALLEHNLQTGDQGVPVLHNITATSPIIRNLVASTGVNIAESGGNLFISATDIPFATKTVIVNELSDLPAPIGSVITLVDDTDYFFGNDINLGSNRIVLANGLIRAADSSVVELTYTGTDPMFTGVDKNSKITKINLSCANSHLLDVSGAACTFQLIDCSISECDEVGHLGPCAAIQITDVFFSDAKSNGIEFFGNIPILIFERVVMFLNGGTMFDFGTATFDGFSTNTSFLFPAAGTVGMDGLVDSGNINANGLGSMLNNRILDPGAGFTPIVGIDPADDLWQFIGNNLMPDSRSDILMSHSGPTTITIAAANTPVRIAPNWSEEIASQFTSDANGRMTYTGGKGATLPITFSISCEAASGVNKDITLYVYKDGGQQANSFTTNRVSAGDPKNTTVIWQDALVAGEYIECWIECNSGTFVDLVINSGVMRIN